MHNFKELKVWQLSRALVKDVYVITAEFPVTEKFGLVSQLCRDAGLISEDQLNLFSTKISEIQKMTHGLIKSMRQESYV